MNPNALIAYVVNNLSNDVTPINLTNNAIGALIGPVGTNPVVVAITPDNQTAQQMSLFIGFTKKGS